tara:strand:+ start:3002 stop:3175 length:174 start_codon:yes stop_codon:yes gene_type:complete
MRTLSKKEVIIVQRINQQRDLLMNQEFNMEKTDSVLAYISDLNIELINISNANKLKI